MFPSQCGQDEFLEKNIFKGYKNGFYVDIGAHDGLTINNTIYFSKYNNWKGINVEAIKEVYDKLVENRPTDININCAICNKDGEAEFITNKGYTEMISGLKDNYDPRHVRRLDNELRTNGGTSETIIVQTKKLQTIFNEHNVTHVNYLSIDVEGAEFDVIKSIDFDSVFIDVIGFENNYYDSSVPIIKYLEEKNYRILEVVGHDIFMINKNSQFFVI
jgi:FkbM family methyltransferase